MALVGDGGRRRRSSSVIKSDMSMRGSCRRVVGGLLLLLGVDVVVAGRDVYDDMATSTSNSYNISCSNRRF